SLRASGPIAQLPAGPLTMSGLVEHREEQAGDWVQSVHNPNGTGTVSWTPTASETVQSYYAEARAPIFSETNSGPLLHTLELMGAIRRDEYKLHAVPRGYAVSSASGPFPDPSSDYFTSNLSSTDYTLGLRYSPGGGLTFRASHGTGFLPPVLNEIASIITTLPA